MTTSPPAARHNTPLLEARSITQRFGPLTAVDNVDFDVRSGEVAALLGENGAGKSTLMKVLCGVNQPQVGTVMVNGTRLTLGSPQASRAAGIGMVFQDLRLIPAFTVAENIALSLDTRPGSPALARRITEVTDRYQLSVDPAARVADLDLARRQQVEILRVLMADARIVILDEPTSALAPQEVDALMAIIDELRQAGLGVVLITHKLRETRQVADRVTVLRAGRVIIGDAEPATYRDDDLVVAMVGDVPPPLPAGRTPVGKGVPALAVNDLTVRGDDGRVALEGVTFIIQPGETVGVAGVAGNGQRELTEAVMGLRSFVHGTVHIAGSPVSGDRPTDALRAGGTHDQTHVGAVMVTEDPVHDAVVPGLDVLEHLVLTGRPLPRRGAGIDWKTAREAVADRPEATQLGLVGLDRRVDQLSGGNIQRVMLARVLLVDSPALMVVSYPTRGLDVASVRSTQQLLLQRRASGTGILMVSEDLDELLEMSDRIVVLHDGSVAGIVTPQSTDRRHIGELMTAGS
jgi:simple sugar transport system ATP-binding protein